MDKTPRYILRNCDIFVDRVDKIGQASTIKIPELRVKTDTIRNAGMVKERHIALGYEALEMSFTMTAFDPQVLRLYGLAPGVEREFMATGALADEDGAVHSAVCYMRGMLDGVTAGDWTSGEKSEADYSVKVNYLKLDIDGNSIIEVDDFGVSIGGVSQTDAIRRALLTS